MTNSWKVLFIIAIILSVFLCRSLAIENVKFVVFSDPHLSLPAEGVIDDFKLGLHSLELLENTIKDIMKFPT